MKTAVESFFHTDSNTITHVFLCAETRQCVLIDTVLDFNMSSGRTSTRSADLVLHFVQEQALKVVGILETHVHADHLSAAPYMRSKTGAPVMIGTDTHKVAAAFAPVFPLPTPMRSNKQHANSTSHATLEFDRLLVEGDQIAIGHTQLKVMATPGHTAGCITYFNEQLAFVGDTLFMPDFGTARADFPGGSAATLYRSIQRILALPADTRLYLCHDYKAPGRDEFAWESTVAEQRAHNVHLAEYSVEAAFVAFRQERDAKLSMPALLLPSVQVNLRGGHFPAAESNGVHYLRIPLNYF